jgi:hypothetical protein
VMATGSHVYDASRARSGSAALLALALLLPR